MNVAVENLALPVNVIDGRRLAHQLPHLSPSVRSRLAYKLSTGAAVLQNPTQAMSARVMGVSESSVSMVAHRARQPSMRPRMSDQALMALISRVGADRVLCMLDKITAPAVMA
jgi:hypothetical protein